MGSQADEIQQWFDLIYEHDRGGPGIADLLEFEPGMTAFAIPAAACFFAFKWVASNSF